MTQPAAADFTKPELSRCLVSDTTHGQSFIFSDENRNDYEEQYLAQDYEDECNDDDNDLYDLYGDFSLSTKAPRPRSRSTLKSTLSTAAHPNQKRNCPQFRSIRPIPPEILHLIFSQVDHATLCNINMASRHFHAIAKDYIEIEGTWNVGTEKNGDLLIEKMKSGSVNVLKIDCPTRWLPASRTYQRSDPRDGAWLRFVELITEPIDDEQHRANIYDSTEAISLREQDPEQPSLLDRVKKIIIGDSALPALLPYLHRVHTLEIMDQNFTIYRDIHLQSIFKACASLDTLIVDGCGNYEKIWIGWSKDRAASGTNTWTNSRLTHFSITWVSIGHDTMEAFLIACPRLIYFRARDVHFRQSGTDSSTNIVLDYTNVQSLPLKDVYRQVARLRPNLHYLSVTPERREPSDSLATQLRLMAELFPRIQHVDVEMHMPDDYDWYPDPVTAKFLAQLRSLEFFHSYYYFPHRMDRLLKHCRKLIRLDAHVAYSRPDPLPHLSVPRIRYQSSLSSSWRCPHLRVLELGLPYYTSVKQEEDVFRFLLHACPNLQELSLHLGTLRVGQEGLEKVTHKEFYTETVTISRRHKRPYTFTETRAEYVATEVWKEEKNTFCLLGRLSRLERLHVSVGLVPGVLYLSTFAFLRRASIYDCGRDMTAKVPVVFCPQLQSLRVHSSKWIAFGKRRGEPLDRRQFVNALKAMRPEVAISFQDNSENK